MSNIVALNSFPSPQEFTTMKEMGAMAVKSGLLPTSINTAEKAVIIMLKGREIGIGPMEAFAKISVINGKPSMDAELMLSQVYKKIPKAEINIVKTTNTECVIEAARPGKKPTTFSFTMEDAKRADLLNKGPWKSYPAAMLRARTISAMARAIFPDALSGVSYTPEELGAEVDGDGQVIDVTEAPKTSALGLKYAESTPASGAIPEVLTGGDIGDFIIPCWPEFKGQKLKDVNVFDVDKIVKWAKSKKLYPDFVEVAEAYLTSKEFER